MLCYKLVSETRDMLGTTSSCGRDSSSGKRVGKGNFTIEQIKLTQNQYDQLMEGLKNKNWDGTWNMDKVEEWKKAKTKKK